MRFSSDPVTPCVGVWIETWSIPDTPPHTLSHPAWVCGLKQYYEVEQNIGGGVTPCVGVWIETHLILRGGQTIYSHTLRGCVD